MEFREFEPNKNKIVPTDNKVDNKITEKEKKSKEKESNIVSNTISTVSDFFHSKVSSSPKTKSTTSDKMLPTAQNEKEEVNLKETQEKITAEVKKPVTRRTSMRIIGELGKTKTEAKVPKSENKIEEEKKPVTRKSSMRDFGKKVSQFGDTGGKTIKEEKDLEPRVNRFEKKSSKRNVTNAIKTEEVKTPVMGEKPKYVTTANAMKLMERITTDLNKALLEKAEKNVVDESLEGPFRQVGDRTVIKDLLLNLENPEYNISSRTDLSIKDLCSACKDVIKDLNIIDGDFKKAYLAVPDINNKDENEIKGLNNEYVNSLTRSFEGLDPEKRKVLKNLCLICELLNANSDVTKMTRSNCAIAPGPAVFKPDEDINKNFLETAPSQKAFVLLLENHEAILPPEIYVI